MTSRLDVLKMIYNGLFQEMKTNKTITELQLDEHLTKSELLFSTTVDGRTQRWIVRAGALVEFQPNEEDVSTSMPEFDPLPLSDIQGKTPKFWMQVFNGAWRERMIRFGEVKAKYINKIDLIKSYRSVTGDGLKESKDAIDQSVMLDIFAAQRDPKANMVGVEDWRWNEYYIVGSALQSKLDEIENKKKGDQK